MTFRFVSNIDGTDFAEMFGFRDWVGRRNSMDSSIGLSTMIAIGSDNFWAMLERHLDADASIPVGRIRRDLALVLADRAAAVLVERSTTH